MITEVSITELSDVMDILTDQEYVASYKRNRSRYLYRGLSNSEYHLETSLYRNCKDKQYDLEVPVLRNFMKYAAGEDGRLKDSIWHQMIIGQHHGLPTRLLDWTYSPLIGLHFSTTEDNCDNMNAHDCVLWKMDIMEINSLLPKEYWELLKRDNAFLFTVDMLNEIARSIEDYDLAMNNQSIVLLEPPSIDQRIINQYSYFSIVPKGIDNLEQFLNLYTQNTVKYKIDKNLRWRIRDMLDQMNVNERIVYPGLDGLSKWIKRHYYVK